MEENNHTSRFAENVTLLNSNAQRMLSQQDKLELITQLMTHPQNSTLKSKKQENNQTADHLFFFAIIFEHSIFFENRLTKK